jgi:hypothetical protein
MATQNVPHDAFDTYNLLEGKAAQLSALLLMTCGNNCESFGLMADTTRDNFMWACSDLAEEVFSLIGELAPAILA